MFFNYSKAFRTKRLIDSAPSPTYNRTDFSGGVRIVKHLPKNREIKNAQVRLIDTDTGIQTVMAIADALKLAEEANLDLVAVSPNSDPPVCKVLDYSNYIYNQGKLEKKAKKTVKSNVLKELKLTPKIGEHDYQVRFQAAQKFLAKGHKVKMTVFFRGREITHPDVGLALLRRVNAELGDTAQVDHGPVFNGPTASMVLSPKK